MLKRVIKVKCLIDIEISIESFVDINYIKKYRLLILLLTKLYRLRLIDNKLVSDIIYMAQL